MPGIIQTLVITRQHFGQIPTYCKKCRKQITFKITNEDGSYTQKCDCGCRILSYHSPDENHQTAFFTSLFISMKQFDPDYKNKDTMEKLGFQKTNSLNGKTRYEK